MLVLKKSTHIQHQMWKTTSGSTNINCCVVVPVFRWRPSVFSVIERQQKVKNTFRFPNFVIHGRCISRNFVEAWVLNTRTLSIAAFCTDLLACIRMIASVAWLSRKCLSSWLDVMKCVCIASFWLWSGLSLRNTGMAQETIATYLHEHNESCFHLEGVDMFLGYPAFLSSAVPR